MSIGNAVNKVAAAYPKLGPALFVSGIQYFLVQLIVSRRFTPSYSVRHNTISDLGNTTCSVFNGRMICSPLHSLMNSSFFILGLTMIIGSLLLYSQFDKSKSSRVGFSLFGVGGLGALLVALYPENTVPALHGIGALLPFLIGNIGLVVISFSFGGVKFLRLYTRFSGAVALVALTIYSTGHFVGLGEGGIERVVAYPQTIWMITFGMWLLARKSERLRHA